MKLWWRTKASPINNNDPYVNGSILNLLTYVQLPSQLSMKFTASPEHRVEQLIHQPFFYFQNINKNVLFNAQMTWYSQIYS